MTYPLFIPPPALQGIETTHWSIAQARVYFEWLMSTKHDRVNFLLEWAGATKLDQKNQIDAVDHALYLALKCDNFVISSTAGPQLTAEGYALGADCGLFIAHVLISRFSDQISWLLCRYGGKSYACYNHAILWGFNLDFDPINKGIVQAKSLLLKKSPGGVSRLIAHSSEYVGPACEAQLKIRGRDRVIR